MMTSIANDKPYKYDLFLSHSGTDGKWAKKLATEIENNKEGAPLHVYLAEWDLPPGGNIPRELGQAIEESRCLGLILSPEAISSGWVSLECDVAVCRDPAAVHHSLIPLLRRECKIPTALTALKYIDFRRDESFNYSLRALIAAIRGEPLRSSTQWTEEEVNSQSDVASLREQVVAFDRDAFRLPCINDLSIPELRDAIDDTQAALNTGTLNSRKGALLKNIPTLRSYKTEHFRKAMTQVSEEITNLKRIVTSLLVILRELDADFEHSDFAHVIFYLGLKYKYGSSESFLDKEFRDGIGIQESMSLLMRTDRIKRYIEKIKIGQEDLEPVLKKIFSVIDEIDEKRNSILQIVNSLLALSGDEEFPLIKLSSQVIKDNDNGIAEGIREDLGELLGLPKTVREIELGKSGSPIKRVSIIEGCFPCGACHLECPEVFYLSPSSTAAIVHEGAEAYFETHRLQIEHAAAECPVSVIKIEYAEQTSL